jgi:hypothetical protein
MHRGRPNKFEINRRWGLTAARACARLLIELKHVLVLGLDDVTELGAQARKRQFYYSRWHAMATTTQIAPTAGADGGEGKLLNMRAR